MPFEPKWMPGQDVGGERSAEDYLRRISPLIRDAATLEEILTPDEMQEFERSILVQEAK